MHTALWQREAIPLLTAVDVARSDIPCVTTTDDLAVVLDLFTRFDAARLPVCLPESPETVIGFISRAGLLKHYHGAATEGR